MKTLIVEYVGNTIGDTQSKWAKGCIFEVEEGTGTYGSCYNVIRLIKKGKYWDEEHNTLTSFFKFNGRVLKDYVHDGWFEENLFKIE